MISKPLNTQTYLNLYKLAGFNFLQSFEWGEVKKHTWQSIRLTYNNKIPLTVFKRKLPIIGSVGYIPRAFNKDTIESTLITELINYTKNELKISILIIEPNLTVDIDFNFSKYGFHNSTKNIQPRSTIIIDLEKDILSNYSPSTRRKLNKLAKLKLSFEVEKYPAKGLDSFIEILGEIKQRKHVEFHDKDYYSKILKEFNNQDNQAFLHLCKLENKVVGAYLVIHSNEVAYELYGGMNTKAISMNLGYYIKHNSILHAQNNGCKIYDQWGVARKKKNGEFDEKDPLFPISFFKDRFGGKYIEFYPQQIYVFSYAAYILYFLLEKAKYLKLKLKKTMNI